MGLFQKNKVPDIAEGKNRWEFLRKRIASSENVIDLGPGNNPVKGGGCPN